MSTMNLLALVNSLINFKSIQSLGKKEDGVTAIEYGLIAALIAVVIIGGVTLVGTSLTGIFATVAGSL